MSGLAVEIDRLDFTYERSGFQLGLERFAITPGQVTGLVGPSGAGKTTLLHLIAGIRSPRSGRIVVGNCDMTASDDAARRAFRIRNIGLVFQDFALLEHLTILDNVLLPYRLSPQLQLGRKVVKRAADLADHVGLGDKLRRGVNTLSQGERQRVAVCRALLPQPKLILADEPTGNLDPANKERVARALLTSAKNSGASLLMVTHDHSLLDTFDTTFDCAAFLAGNDAQQASTRGLP